jgi:hypothetical protein
VPLCESALGRGLTFYDWGGLLEHCTRHNGQPDAEDLNNDQHLDTLIAASGEQHFRYVFRVGDDRYFVRAGGTVNGVGQWKLYRIPFRSDTVQVGAPDIRQIRALRLTVAVPQSAQAESTLFFALARMRLVGAPWIKRAGTPIPGIAGLQGAAHGEVVASVVTTENLNDLGYTSPPGVTDQGAQISGAQVGATQINEKSLRLIATDVRAGERAEAYYHFPEGDRNFLGYRELRVWARGRGAGWDDRELAFYIKVAQDENNFYLYRVPVGTTTWLPEVVVDFNRWFQLRASIETRFLSGQGPGGAPTCGGDTLAYVACDGPYLVHVRDPAVAPPNLTRVQELAVGFVRDSGVATDTSELWVDDIRLTGVVNTPGYAGAVTLNLTAADIATVSLAATRRDGNFRQLGENPSYLGQSGLALNTTIRLERLGLERLGLTAPLTIHAEHSSQDPYFLSNTDVLAAGLQGLRSPVLGNTSYALSIRRSRRGTQWWQRVLTDNIGLSASFSSGSARTELSTASSRLSDLRADYAASPRDVGLPALPGVLRRLLGALPGFLRESDLVRGLRDSRLRLTPVSVQFSSGLTRTSSQLETFRVPIAAAFDSALPVRTTTAALRSTAAAELRPFGSLGMGVSGTWDRDLRDYADSTPTGAIAGGSAQRFLGMNLGFVRQRTVATHLTWTPPVAGWFHPRFNWTSNFGLSRDPNGSTPERTVGDTAGGYRLPTVWSNGMTSDLSANIDLSRLLRSLLGDSSGLRRALDRVTQVDLGRRIDRRSQYARAGFDPGLGYQLGLGGIGAFLGRDGRAASAASDNQQDRASVSVRFPLSVTVTGQYGQTDNTTWFLRGTQQQAQRSVDTQWPNVTARWLWTPRPAWIRAALTSINASVGVSERSSTSEMPPLDATVEGATTLRITQTTHATPVSLTVVSVKGITASVSLNNEHAEADRSGATTLSDRRSTAADVAFAFRPPQEVIPLRSDIRTALRFLSAVVTSCAKSQSILACTPIADSRRTEYNLTMDTDMPPSVSAGLAVGYVLNDDRYINRKFSQFTLTVSVRVSFAAGELR